MLGWPKQRTLRWNHPECGCKGNGIWPSGTNVDLHLDNIQMSKDNKAFCLKIYEIIETILLCWIACEFPGFFIGAT